MVVRANLIFQKRAPAKFETGPCEIRKDALKTTGTLWQKCHTGSFSDSRLLREARMLHYVPTSRSARIVVKPLHESPGPTTAGASLFCVSFSPRPSPERPPSDSFCGPALTSQSSVRYYHCRRRQNPSTCEPENRPRSGLRRRGRAYRLPAGRWCEFASQLRRRRSNRKGVVRPG